MSNITIKMSDRDKIQSNQMLLSETMFLRGQEMVVDLVMFDMSDFDIMLDMDFFSHYET